MNWAPTELQQAIASLAPDVLAAPEPWDELERAELLEVDGILETCSLLIEVGRAGAPVPVLETLVLGGPIRAVLGRRPGEVLTGALLEPGSRDPRTATTTAVHGRLTGAKTCVPALDRATRVVVPTTDGLYAVEVGDGVVHAQLGTASDPLGALVLDHVAGVRLGGVELIAPWLRRVHLGIAALQLGLCRSAVALTATYVRERKQFGVPVGSFQAVRQRLADAWIDLQGVEVALWQAAHRVAHDEASSDREVAIARYVAADGSHRILTAAQHLHGGFGFDRDYPLHRRFLVSKQWEFLLGGASARLEELGDLLATTPISP